MAGIKAYEASAFQRLQRFQAACVHVRFFAVASRRAMVAAAMHVSMSALIDGLVSTKIDGFPVACSRSL